MAKLFKRSRAHPDIEYKTDGSHTRMWVLGDRQVLDLGHKSPFYGPGVIVEVEHPTNLEWHEYEVDSPFVWAWISRLFHEGHITNRGVMLSHKKENEAPAIRTRDWEDRK